MRPRPHRPSNQSAANMTGAGTAPNPRLSGSLKFFRAAATPGAISGPMSAPEVSVASIEPVLTWRIEHVHIEGVLESQCAVRQVRRDHQDFAGADREFSAPVLAQPKVQRAFQNVRDLFVLMRMTRHIVALLEIHVRDHHALGRDQAPRDPALQRLGAHIVPPIVPGARRILFAGNFAHLNCSSICKSSATACRLVSFARPMIATNSACCSGVIPFLRAAAPCDAMQYLHPFVTLTAI